MSILLQLHPVTLYTSRGQRHSMKIMFVILTKIDLPEGWSKLPTWVPKLFPASTPSFAC
jgi:hypothetical protein